MFEQRLEHLVERTVVSLPDAHTGLVLVVLVGFSFSLSHVFSLLANRLKPRQILFHVLLDSLVLAAALLIASFINMVMIALHTQLVVEPKSFQCHWRRPGPGLLCAGGRPYVSDLIAITIWVLIHLNVITLVHLRFGLPYAEVLPLVTPGYVVALVLIALLSAPVGAAVTTASLLSSRLEPWAPLLPTSKAKCIATAPIGAVWWWC